MSSPAFSIVIPTRNRPEVLRSALATTLRLRSPDLEIVVSDNGPAADARPVVEELDDGRVRYVRPDRPMTQPEHYEFAVSRSRGEWVVVYGDDDGVPESFLDRLNAAITDDGARLVGWPPCHYVHPGTTGSGGNRLTVLPFTGSVQHVRSRDLLAQAFAVRERLNFASVGLNAAVRRDLFDDVRALTGRIFHPPVLDWTFGTLALAVEPHHVWVDQPLTIRGITATSLTDALMRQAAPAHAFLKEMGRDGSVRCVPLKMHTIDNLCVESMMRARALAPHLFDGLELDRTGYLLACYRDLNRDTGGMTAPHDAAAWRSAVRGSNPLVRIGVLRGVLAHRTRAGVRGLRALSAGRLPGAATTFRAVRRRMTPHHDFLNVDADAAPFTDLAGAARYLEQHVLAGVPHPYGGAGPRVAVGTGISP